MSIDGFEGQLKAEVTLGPLDRREIFYIRRNPPFRFAADISLKEIPLSYEEQEDYNTPISEEIDSQLEKMKDCLIGIPFEVLDEEALKVKIREAGFDHFIDLNFPPNDDSIWSPECEGKFPLKEKPVWKRPTEFMKGTPELFCDGIDPNDINQGALGN